MRLFLALTLFFILSLREPCISASRETDRPNVVLIMTDDQGYGDFGFTGNPIIQTPHLDRLASESVFLTNFCVSPVCTPTRACLLTGRYNYRTRAIDTYRGRAMMDPDEVTLAETLSSAGYETGIFGKWHLGDCYPMRAMDQGFKESLVLRGGGLSQPSDPPESTGYFDPVLFRNGVPVKTKGYCSDIYTDEAIAFIQKNKDRPFFVYLPFNCPHSPHEVKEQDYLLYKDKVKSANQFNYPGYPLEGEFDAEQTARLYGMVTNIDENIGKVLSTLETLQLTENTIVVFLTDNGPAFPRYNGIFRGRKTQVYEGGIRVVCLWRWPKHFEPGTRVDLPLAHIDIVPTIEEVCGVIHPVTTPVDGRSFLKPLLGEPVEWPERTLFFQWHRGNAPELHRNFTARGSRYKLVQPTGGADGKALSPEFELYDLIEDPCEKVNISANHPDIVNKLLAEYEDWFHDVSGTRGYDPPRIVIGDPHSPHVSLTRQDWRDAQTEWKPEGLGYWEVKVIQEGPRHVDLVFNTTTGPGKACFRCGGLTVETPLAQDCDHCTFEAVQLKAGEGRIEAWVEVANRRSGVRFVEIGPATQP